MAHRFHGLLATLAVRKIHLGARLCIEVPGGHPPDPVLFDVPIGVTAIADYIEQTMSTHRGDTKEERGVATKERAKTKRPKLYKVLLHNDDYTTMEFVILVLTKFFNKSRTDATRIMLLIHHTGMGVAGVYSNDIAQTKITQVGEYAQRHEFPLRCTVEAD